RLEVRAQLALARPHVGHRRLEAGPGLALELAGALLRVADRLGAGLDAGLDLAAHAVAGGRPGAADLADDCIRVEGSGGALGGEAGDVEGTGLGVAAQRGRSRAVNRSARVRAGADRGGTG